MNQLETFQPEDMFRKNASWVALLDRHEWPSSNASEAKLTQIADTIWSKKGKRLRPHLVYWFGEMMGIPAERLQIYAWAAEAVHTATLLHDDVIDQATLRRGGASANQIYDNTLPVISGDYLLSDALHRIALEGSPRVLVALCETLKELCAGECLQYEMKFKIGESEEIYRQIAESKTGSLFRWCALVAPLLRDSDPTLLAAVRKAIGSFGVLFQWSDDVLDVIGTRTKTRWSDLREGKLNFATWNMIQLDERLKRALIREFSEKDISEELIRAFEKESENERVISLVRKRLRLQAERAEASARLLPESPIRSSLENLIRLCVDRSY